MDRGGTAESLAETTSSFSPECGLFHLSISNRSELDAITHIEFEYAM